MLDTENIEVEVYHLLIYNPASLEGFLSLAHSIRKALRDKSLPGKVKLRRLATIEN